MAGSTPPKNVFVSYSREDREWRRAIQVMLGPHIREGRLELWTDRRIKAGDDWRERIMAAIERADAALLIVSPDFLDSAFITEHELPALEQRGIPRLCVLARDCLLSPESRLTHLQWLHDPLRDGALSAAGDRDRAIRQVCGRLVQALELDSGAAPPLRVIAPRAVVEPLRAGEGPGPIDQVPALPEGYVRRDADLARLRSAILQGDREAIGIAPVGLHGLGGIGKSVLAAALIHDSDVAAYFPDGVFWITTGAGVDVVAAQLDLLARLGEPARAETRLDALHRLRAALRDRQCLLIVDDVWSGSVANAFRVVGPRGRLLYTTRNRRIVDVVGARVELVDVLSEHTARQLLARLTRDAELPETAEFVMEATGCVALALALVGAAIGRGGRSWEQVAEMLERGSETFLNHPYANTFKAMQVAVAALEPDLARAYESLVVLPEDTDVPIAVIMRYWEHLGLPESDLLTTVEALAERRLLTRTETTIAFHDLQREFLLLQVTDLEFFHGEMVAAHRRVLGPGDPDWSQLPPDEPYMRDHLIFHLSGAVDAAAVAGVVEDAAYLTTRMFYDGPHAAEADLERAIAACGPSDTSDWWLRTLTQSGSLFVGHANVASLANTVLARAVHGPNELRLNGLSNLLRERCLVPHRALTQAHPALLRVLHGHEGWVRSVAFAPSGTRAASAGEDGVVQLWNVNTGELIATMDDHSGVVNVVVFSSDGLRLASGGGDETVRLWNAGNGQLEAVLDGHTDSIQELVFSSDGSRLLSKARGSTRLWDTGRGALVSVLTTGQQIAALRFSSDDAQVIGLVQGSIRCWDAASGRRLPDSPATDLPSLRVGQDLEGRRVVAVAHEGRSLLLEDRDRTLFARLGADEQNIPLEGGGRFPVTAFAASRFGQVLAAGGDDGTIRLWDGGGRLTATLTGNTGAILSLAFSPDGRHLLSGGHDQTVRLWKASGNYLETESKSGSREITALAAAPDGSSLVAAGDDGVSRWMSALTARAETELHGHRGGVTALRFSPDGSMLASGGRDGTVFVWDAQTREAVAEIDADLYAVRVISFTHDGKEIAARGRERTVRRYAVPAGLAGVHLVDAEVMALEYAPSGRLLAVAAANGAISLWDRDASRSAPTLEQPPANVFAGHDGSVRALAFAPDGSYLASGGHDETVRLWKPSDGTPIATLAGHGDWVHTIAVSPDGALLAAIARRTIRMWDVAARAPLWTDESTTDLSSVLGFSPDGERLVSAREDGTLQLFATRSGELLCETRLAHGAGPVVWVGSKLAVAAGSDVLLVEEVDRASATDRPVGRADPA